MLGAAGQDGVRGGRDRHGQRRDQQPVEQGDGGVHVQAAAEDHLLVGQQEKGKVASFTYGLVGVFTQPLAENFTTQILNDRSTR